MFTTELQYTVIRYMLNELADEAANVGIIAVTDDPPRILFRFLEDPTVKSRNDARIKSDVVERFASFVDNQKQELEAHQTELAPLSTTLFTRLRELGGNLVRSNLPKSVLTNDVNQEFNFLFNQWVAPITASVDHRTYAPRDPLRGLRREACRAITKNIRDALPRKFLKQSFKKAHEVKGQRHTSVFDAALVVKSGKNATEHLFHHVLMLPDAEESFNQAASLLWKWNDVSVYEQNGKDRQLTAVLFSRAGTKRAGVEEAKYVLKKDQVRIAEVGQVGELAKMFYPQMRLPNA